MFTIGTRVRILFGPFCGKNQFGTITKISGSVYYVLLDYLEDTYKYFAYELERV